MFFGRPFPLLFAFVALELCYVDPANPRVLALAIALYSYATWFGMAAVGRHLWAERGEAFTVYFGLLARIAPFAEHDGRIAWRVPFSGLSRPRNPRRVGPPAIRRSSRWTATRPRRSMSRFASPTGIVRVRFLGLPARTIARRPCSLTEITAVAK